MAEGVLNRLCYTMRVGVGVEAGAGGSRAWGDCGLHFVHGTAIPLPHGADRPVKGMMPRHRHAVNADLA